MFSTRTSSQCGSRSYVFWCRWKILCDIEDSVNLYPVSVFYVDDGKSVTRHMYGNSKHITKHWKILVLLIFSRMVVFFMVLYVDCGVSNSKMIRKSVSWINDRLHVTFEVIFLIESEEKTIQLKKTQLIRRKLFSKIFKYTHWAEINFWFCQHSLILATSTSLRYRLNHISEWK